MSPATTATGVLASLRTRAAAGPWRRVLGTDWVLLALIVLVYSQFPDRLRLFDADPLVAFVAVALTLRRVLLGRRDGDLWPLLVPAVAYALICALSLLWASDSVRATTALVRLGKDLVLFVLVAAAIEGVGGLRRAAWAVVIAGILTTAAPIAQWYTGDYQNDLWGFARVELAHLSGEVEGPRATGTLSDPNYFAQSLLPIVALAFGLLWTERGVLARAAAGWAIVAAGACIVLSYSRGGLIGTVAAGGLLVAGFRPWWRSAAMLATCALLVTPVVSRTYLARVASLERVSTLTSLPKSSPAATSEHFVDEPGFRGRVSETLSAYRMLLDHPFTGVGIGNYEFHYQQYALALGLERRQEDREAHSLPLEIAAETGLPGLIACTMLLATILTRVLAARRTLRGRDERVRGLVTAVGIAFAGYLTTSLFLHDAYMRQFWILAALAYAAGRPEPRRDRALAPHGAAGPAGSALVP